MVSIAGKIYDVLSYNPTAARELLARAGFPNGLTDDGRQLTFEFRVPKLSYSPPIAEVLQQQWRRNLRIGMRVLTQELKAYIPMLLSGRFEMAENGGGADYGDPNTFLNLFQTGGDFASVWSDDTYDGMLRAANSTVNTATRMKELARCEAYLLCAMPMIPLLNYGSAGFQKPYVRGLTTNLLDVHPFKYAWIDTHWRPHDK